MGLFGSIREDWQNAPKDERGLMLSSMGDALIALGTGRPMANQAQQMLMQKRQDRQTRAELDASGIMDTLSPRQRQALAMMPASKATEIVAGMLMQPEPGPTKGVVVGGNLVNPFTGQVIYEGGGDPSAAEAKIERAMQAFGLDRATATKVAEGYIKVHQDPMTREVTLLDSITGQPWAGHQQNPQGGGFGVPQVSTELLDPVKADPANVASDTIATLAQTATNYDIDPADAYGVEGMLKKGVNAVGDAIGVGTAYPEVGQIQADVSVLRENMLGDFAAGYNRQPPSWVLKNIDELTPKAGTLGGYDTQIRKVESLRNSFSTELDTLRRQVARKQSPTSRQAVEAKIIALESAIGRVDAFLQSHARPSGFSEADQSLIDKWAD